MFRKLSVLAIALLLLVACAPEPELPTRSENSAPPEVVDAPNAPIGTGEVPSPIDTSRRLTISTHDYAEEALHSYANAFIALHPDVSIEIHASKYYAGSNRATALATQLMGGQGDDLILMSALPYVQWSRLGMFVNLDEFLDNDLELRDDFYPQLLDAFTVDGGLYALPRNIALPAYMASPGYAPALDEQLGEQTTLTYREVIAVFNSLREEHPALRYPGNGFIINYLLSAELSRFYDSADGRVEFGQEFIEMVTELQPYFIPNYNIPPSGQAALFGMYLGVSGVIQAVRLLPGAPDRVWAVSGLSGNPCLWSSGMYGINANSENKELAWEFLKFFGSVEGRRATMELDSISARKSVMYGVFLTNAERFGISSESAARALEIVEGIFEDFREFSDDDTFLSDTMQSGFDDYNNGLLTPEQFAARLQEKLTLYVNQ